MKGIIIKGISGFYYVKVEDTIFQCKARGIFKKDGIIPYVGDEVIIEIIAQGEGEAVINQICPGKNEFVRPSIANVDCFIIVVAATRPEPNPEIIDRFLVMAEKSRTDIVVCINKIDLVSEEKLAALDEIYSNIYPVVHVCGSTGYGIEAFANLLKGKKSALAGPSGSGKSTLLNRLQLGLNVETGEIGHKSKRGKHTTRHVEIFQMDFGGMIFDTPGFTSFDILEADLEELQFLYPEISALVGGCKFDNCRHVNEPDCCVQEAVKTGKIHSSRYHSYVNQYNDIQEKRKY